MTQTPRSDLDAAVIGATEALATCHLIIGHPDTARFLAVRHDSGWSPPTVRFPAGPTGHRAEMISEGVARKYGLKVRVLRPLVSAHDYHCIEAELAGGTRDGGRLEAVWVGREQYERFRNADGSDADPFEDWLNDRERDHPPKQRAPWQRPGWFDDASHWIQFQLDRLQLQSTGSIRQVRAGGSRSCLLSVPTSQGQVWFKASWPGPLSVAALTAALDETFTGRIYPLLAGEPDRDWMLFGEAGASAAPSGNPSRWPAFARQLAVIQVGATADRERWLGTGCPDRGLTWLAGFLGEADRWRGLLAEGGGRLDPDTIGRLSARMDGWRGRVEALARHGVPKSLVHGDFRPAHFIALGEADVIADWADTVMGHPFFALASTALGGELLRAAAPSSRRWPVPGPEVMAAIESAYLEPFRSGLDDAVVRGAFADARALWSVWRFSRSVEELEGLEPESMDYVQRVVRLQGAARALLEKSV